MQVGTVEGAVNTERFKFEAHEDIEKFDFVTVKANTDEAEWLLAQVDEVEKKPITDAAEDAYKTIAHANIIGYRVNGLLKRPRSVIEPDSLVYQADQDVISETLGLEQDGLYMGLLETNPDIDIFLDPEDLYKHIAVLAQTGAGKSYSTSVMIEELLEQNYPVVIIDPHGEYHSLDTPNDIDEEDKREYGVVPEAYETQEYSPNTDLNQHARKLTFSSKNMDANEIQQIVPTNLTNSQLGVLYTALKELKKRDAYSLDDVIETCMDQDSKAKWNLINMLEAVKDSGMFSEDPTPIEELVQPGRATIINLKGVDPENQESTVYQLAKQLFEMRKRGKLEPFFMIIEEAHNFVPEKGMGKAVSSDIMRKIASEGRKFGLGLGVISQRPANVAKNILSQCNTQIIMRVTNPNDLKAISRSFEGVTKEVEGSITSLPPGTGLILGKEYPIMTDIRIRRSQHGGETKDVSDEEGLEKREETKSLAEQAEDEEPDLSVDEDMAAPAEPEQPDETDEEEKFEEPEEPETDEDLGKEPVPDEERMPTVESIRPVMDPEDTGLPDPTAAYYPLWLVTTSHGKIAIDATDGTVKDRKLNLTEEARSVLQELEKGSKTFEALDAAVAIETDRLELIIDQLQDVDLIEMENGSYFYSSLDLFDREHVDAPANDAMILDEDMTEDEIIDIAKDELGGDIEDVEKIYYPYYTDNERVFDAVQGTEV